MVAKSTDKQVSFFLDEKDRDQWQKLCKTSGISSSMVLRSWILSALQKQKIDVEVAPEQVNSWAAKTIDNSQFDSQLNELMTRIDSLERQQSVLENKDLEFIKDEVLGDDMGTLRNRLGVCESLLQSLGGSIAWEKVVKDAKEHSEQL